MAKLFYIMSLFESVICVLLSRKKPYAGAEIMVLIDHESLRMKIRFCKSRQE